MTDKQKIVKYLEFKGVSKNKFYLKTGLSTGFLDKGSSLGVDKLRTIIDNYQDFNPNWLLLNEKMVLPEINGNTLEKFNLKTDRTLDVQSVPLYNIEAVAGLVPLFNNPQETKTEEYISIPNLPKCDGALTVTGDSMYPLLKSGDIVAYKTINDFSTEIFWGEMYLISVEVADEEYISVKYIQKSDKGEKYIKLVSQNQNHQPKDVSLKKVRAMALVKASIRINSMG